MTQPRHLFLLPVILLLLPAQSWVISTGGKASIASPGRAHKALLTSREAVGSTSQGYLQSLSEGTLKDQSLSLPEQTPSSPATLFQGSKLLSRAELRGVVRQAIQTSEESGEGVTEAVRRLEHAQQELKEELGQVADSAGVVQRFSLELRAAVLEVELDVDESITRPPVSPESKLQQLDKEISSLSAQLADPAVASSDVQELQANLRSAFREKGRLMSEARLQQGIEEKEKRKGGRRYNKLLREGAGLEKQDDLWDLRLEVAKLEDEVEELNASSMASEIMVGNLKFEREGSVRAPADKSRDLLLYIPGVDGLKIEGENQFDELSKHFDLWCVTFKGDDRTQFPQLLASVVEFMRLAGVSEDQKCVISGTSFGAMLAMGVAQIRPELVKGVAAVNPATSYERSVWPVVGNLVGLSPSTESFTVAAAAALVASLPDTAKIQRAMEDIFSLPLGERPMASVDMFLGYGSMMQQLLGEISPESLRFRLKNWLKAGAARVNSRLADMETPVLLIVGEEDRMLPSTEEAARLKAEVKNLEVISLEGIGHSALYDLKAVNLSQMIQDSFLYKGAPAQQDKAEPPNGAGKPKKEDPVKDFKLDTEGEEYKGAVNFMKTLEKLTSPIYLSTTEEGKIIRGLGGVPEHVVGETEPVLFVGNHQLFGGDLPLVVGGLLNQKNILARGLAHPMIFVSEKDPDWDVVLPREAPTAGNAGNDPTVQDLLGELGFNSLAQVASNLPGGQQRVSRVLGSIDGVIQLAQGVQGAGKDAQEKAEKEKNPATGDTQDGQRGLFGTFKALGAVEVNPRNFYRLMQTGQAALLFPGGVREAMHNKGEEYALFWPEQSEFVRVAAQFNATIVPFSAVGTADSVDLVFDGAQMKEFSFGAQSVTAASILPNARPNVEEQIIPPLPIPKLPARHFFLFGKPISTAGVDKKDLAACEAIYKEVKGEVQGGIDYLLESRELDPYMDTTKRLLYEAINGQAAPSFSLQLAAKKREAVRRAEGKDKALEEVGSSR